VQIDIQGPFAEILVSCAGLTEAHDVIVYFSGCKRLFRGYTRTFTDTLGSFAGVTKVNDVMLYFSIYTIIQGSFADILGSFADI